MNNVRNFCIIAHIDHGKSTLADRLLELTGSIEKRKMHAQYLDTMELEQERGITIKLQPVRMTYTLAPNTYILNLIDTPGHVDFSYEVSRSLAAVEAAILLIDATKGIQAQTLANLYLADKQGLKIIPVINKIDLPNARIEEVEEAVSNLLAVEKSEILKISAKTGKGVEEVLKKVIEAVPSPEQDFNKKNLRALIFDSKFDTYKGVLAYVRLVQGSVKIGDTVKLYASGTYTDVVELGYFAPALTKNDRLEAGDIGYIATGLKDVREVRVGDTIMIGDTQPLTGYKEPRPVVFASFYPENGEKYDELRDALSKLKLTDASLVYEPESSPGLGRGFRLGFLGMLHIEIISERLTREFDLKLVISTPSVEYHIKMKNDKEENIRSASLLPDPSLIQSISEPMVLLDIISPSSYVGALMTLMGDLRSNYINTDYLSKELVMLKYRVPLAEIITDFYDNLKSVSSGYASMSYEPDSYNIDDLIRLDILVAGDIIEPFSKIVHKSNAHYQGRRVVDKLKTIIPRQLFVVTIQAAIGGKIIARQDISAMRKDVTGYLYGGDITRKKKLLERQKKGKAKMKASGKVNIPQSVFLEMLKK